MIFSIIKNSAAVEYYIDSMFEDLVPDIHEVELFEANVTDEFAFKCKECLVDG